MTDFVETGLVIGHGEVSLLWHEPKGASGGFLPDDGPNSDARKLWEFFWNNWAKIQGFAHTHPEGCVGPSHTDITTFAAIELGLDLRFDWWIVEKNVTSLVRWKGPDRYDYNVIQLAKDPPWAASLRDRSMKKIPSISKEKIEELKHRMMRHQVAGDMAVVVLTAKELDDLLRVAESVG